MYDVIVIGQDVSSLIAAARCAQLGRKVVLLSENAAPDRIEMDGYSFDLDPLPWPSAEKLQDLPAHPCLAPFAPREDAPNGAFHSGLQIIHPEHRIDFLAGKYAYMKELCREFPGWSLEIGKFLNAAESAEAAFRSAVSLFRHPGMFPRLLKVAPKLLLGFTAWSLNTKFLKDAPELGSILSAQSTILSNSCTNGRIPFSSAYLLTLPLKGPGWLNRRKGAILEELRELLRSSGGGLIGNCTIRRLLTGREIEAVILDRDQELNLSGKSLILSAKWRGIANLVQDDKISKWIKRHAKLKKKTYYPFTLHLGVNEKGLPERMTESVILVHSEPIIEPAAGCSAVFVHTGESSYAPAGRRAVSATVFLEESPCDIDDARMAVLPGVILDRLKFFLPFLKENIEKMDQARSIDLSRRYQEVVNGRYGTNGGVLGFPLVMDMMPKRNIAVVGGELFPGLGFEGEIISGIDAANRISGGKK